ncbi:hypothetical protein D9758_013413 [Tetrapyrgos nigripes]|uniref:Uncharacterized protein n=1 Tax=Tetrapyrgos nigripes TaxID=182062 RepID=A0A8H5CK79_9AGAR|nr:hypothetical protein D9758_013413 [Tetrapyrgos nigripes]
MWSKLVPRLEISKNFGVNFIGNGFFGSTSEWRARTHSSSGTKFKFNKSLALFVYNHPISVNVPSSKTRHSDELDSNVIQPLSMSPTLFESGFPYHSKLKKHTSCINALTFDSVGRFLASGGDDCEIHLWDFHNEDVDMRGPCHTFIGPRNNIFNLEFSISNKYLFAGGTDATIRQYDVASLYTNTLAPEDKLPKSAFLERDIVRDISCFPFNDEVFLSASESGRILRHDLRVNSAIPNHVKASDTIQLSSEVTGVRYHPTMEHLFVTSENLGRVCLRDARLGFGKRSERRDQGVVLQYNTTLTRFSDGKLCKPEASSVTFDSEGKKLAVTMLNFYPTIYGLSDPDPLAVCTTGARPKKANKTLTSVLARNLAMQLHSPTSRTERLEPVRGYSNSCTMKHGSFSRQAPITSSLYPSSHHSTSSPPRTRTHARSGVGDADANYYAAGSDDFRGYVWKVPGVDKLTGMREVLNERMAMEKLMALTGSSEGGLESPAGGLGVGFISSNPDFKNLARDESGKHSVCAPVELDCPCTVLEGHKSIANTVLFHPSFPLILTTGIERYIYVHSPSKSNPFCVKLKRSKGVVNTKEPSQDVAMDVDSASIADKVGKRAESGSRGAEGRGADTRNDDDDEEEEEEEEEEERYTIELFDSILRTEGWADPFDVRGRGRLGEDSSDDDDDDGVQSDSEEDLEC